MSLRKRLAGTYRDLDGPLGSSAAAEVLVPMLIDRIGPASVVDIGCGVGSFVRAFRRAGLNDVVGVDAAEFDRDLLVMEPDRLLVADLSLALDLGRRFDLALCLEVGGYLADHDLLVASLIRHAPVVAFSSAVPGQDLRHQPYGAYLSVWAERFAADGYDLFDPFRAELWHDSRLPFWFRQNLVVFVQRDHLSANPHLTETLGASTAKLLDAIHPELYELLAGTGPDASLRLTALRLPPLLAAKASKFLGRSTKLSRRWPKGSVS